MSKRRESIALPSPKLHLSASSIHRGGEGCDRASVIEQAIAARRLIARREDGSTVGVVGKAVIDGMPVDAIAFGGLGVSDDELRRLLATALDRVQERSGLRQRAGSRGSNSRRE